MHQKKKIALEIATKIASVNGPLRPVYTGDFCCDFSCDFLLLEDMKEYRLLNDVVMKFHNLEHL
jgi:hypothetical protein